MKDLLSAVNEVLHKDELIEQTIRVKNFETLPIKPTMGDSKIVGMFGGAGFIYEYKYYVTNKRLVIVALDKLGNILATKGYDYTEIEEIRIGNEISEYRRDKKENPWKRKTRKMEYVILGTVIYGGLFLISPTTIIKLISFVIGTLLLIGIYQYFTFFRFKNRYLLIKIWDEAEYTTLYEGEDVDVFNNMFIKLKKLI